MKKIIAGILISVTLILSVCLIVNSCKNKKKDMALSINCVNNYCVGNNERRIKQVLYFTRDNIYNTTNLVSSISIIGDDDSTLNLKLNGIKKTGYMHTYLKNKYYSYIYDLTIPKIEGDLVFNNAKIEITSEDNTLTLPIGEYQIKYDKDFDNTKTISVNSLSGLCVYDPYQTLGSINLKLENKGFNNITINKMNMGLNVNLVKEESDKVIYNSDDININETIIGYMENELNLSLSYKKKLFLNESFIEIEYSDITGDYKQIIDTYYFYDNGYKIPDDSDLINTIEFIV